jgi:hypothetical protein
MPTRYPLSLLARNRCHARESAGVPDHVHAAADMRLRIPMRAGLRSLRDDEDAIFCWGMS